MQERFLEGRSALVTGSVQGIGLAIGKALASAGVRLAVHGVAPASRQTLLFEKCTTRCSFFRSAVHPDCVNRPDT